MGRKMGMAVDLGAGQQVGILTQQNVLITV